MPRSWRQCSNFSLRYRLPMQVGMKEEIRPQVWSTAKKPTSASQQSALLGISQVWCAPCILVEARLARKAGEIDDNQQSFGFKKVAPPLLRAVHVKPNDATRKAGLKVIPNFRVPEKSIIYRVFHEGLAYAEAIEELSMWSSSSGAHWSAGPVLVKARNWGDSAHALIIPVRSRGAKRVTV